MELFQCARSIKSDKKDLGVGAWNTIAFCFIFHSTIEQFHYSESQMNDLFKAQPLVWEFVNIEKNPAWNYIVRYVLHSIFFTFTAEHRPKPKSSI